jgi:hypothetical protein
MRKLFSFVFMSHFNRFGKEKSTAKLIHLLQKNNFSVVDNPLFLKSHRKTTAAPCMKLVPILLRMFQLMQVPSAVYVILVFVPLPHMFANNDEDPEIVFYAVVYRHLKFPLRISTSLI